MTVLNSSATALQISRGIVLHSTQRPAAEAARQTVQATLQALGLTDDVEGSGCLAAALTMQWTLKPDRVDAWMPGLNTFGLQQRRGMQGTLHQSDLEREIWLTLLASPLACAFPSAEELISAVRMRVFIVQAARKTALSFHTSEAERPVHCWTYQEKTGFTVRPGSALIEALMAATQPDTNGVTYAFSCYRATEYVMLLAMAQEAQLSNPVLLASLQQQWETKAIMSSPFPAVFFGETGSMAAPFRFSSYWPRAPVWFLNPWTVPPTGAGF